MVFTFSLLFLSSKIIFMTKFIFALFFVCTIAFSAFGQTDIAKYRVFDGKGNPSSFDQIIERAGNSDVVFLGEFHDDSVAHQLQYDIFKATAEKYAARRKVTLSLEMFESDVQFILNEYLANLITEKKFLDDSRPWGNYKTDYRPLVELAKEKKFEVVAANAPRRYVNMVSRGGRETLNLLPAESRRYLPPLPYRKASAAYSAKFKALMGGSAEANMGLDNILDSQSLWDAGMSYSIAKSLKKNKGSLVVHLNGGFHTEKRLGTVEHLQYYNSQARILVVTLRYEEDFKNFDQEKHTDAGDFVILTDAKQPRSKR